MRAEREIHFYLASIMQRTLKIPPLAFQTVPGMLGEDERRVNRELLPAGATRRQADSPAASLI